MRHSTIFLIAALISACVPKTNLAIPITISASGLDDPCGAVGIVANTEKRTYPIRVGPDTTALELLTIENGTRLLLCETRDGWYGVVVLKKGSNCLDGDYGSTSKNYSGPCESGWIEKKYVEYFAG